MSAVLGLTLAGLAIAGGIWWVIWLARRGMSRRDSFAQAVDESKRQVDAILEHARQQMLRVTHRQRPPRWTDW